MNPLCFLSLVISDHIVNILPRLPQSHYLLIGFVTATAKPAPELWGHDVNQARYGLDITSPEY
jgi:hypothetical protein